MIEFFKQEKKLKNTEIIFSILRNTLFGDAIDDETQNELLENLDEIQNKRRSLWERYFAGLQTLSEEGKVRLPHIPDYATNNAHMFYIVCRNLEERTGLIQYLKEHGVTAPFHYLSLHKSEYYVNHAASVPELPVCDMYADCLVRMPMYYELELEQVDMIVELIQEFFKS